MSNLLEKASIVTTPTAYDDGKILSVKPEPSLGNELVVNGDFATNSDWGLQSGWSISGNSLIGTNVNVYTKAYQTLNTKANTYYQVTIDVEQVGSSIYVFFQSAVGQQWKQITSVGVHTFQILSPIINSTLYIENADNSNPDIKVNSVSVKEAIDGDFDFTRNSSATRVNSQGLIEDITSNLPRIDYTGGVGHWLFEPQSTNLVTYSEDFTQSYWRKDKVTVTANSIIAPSGELDASLIQETVYTSGIPSFDLLSSITLSAGTYTYTFYVKNNNGRYLGISFGSNSQRVRTNFDFNTNTFKTLIFNGTTTGSASFTALGDYYRISITATFPSSTAADTVIMPLATDTYPFYAFQNSDNRSFYLWGAQVEAQSFATSYIPTNGSTVTRLQDAAFDSGSSDLINSTEGVLYAEISALADDNSTRVITLSNGTNANRVFIGYWTASNEIRVLVQVGGVTQVFQGNTSYDILNYNKVAFVYKENDFSLWINGSNVFNDTTGITFPAGTLTQLDFDSTGSAVFFGKTKCVAVFKEALTDAELECLTTI